MGCGHSKGGDTSEGEEQKEEEKLSSSPLSSTKPSANGAPTTTVVTPPVPSGVMVANPDVVTILHFNDVYNIEPRDQDPVGGAARFKTAINERKHLNPLVLFSGDAFNPSLMSTITQGKHMVPVLNAMNIQCSVYGNHDFDFGVDVLVKWAKQCNFPWLMSNVTDNLTDEPLADGIVTHMMEWQGRKFGIIGLVEEEWMATLATIDEDDITFVDYVEAGRTLALELRAQGADYIIALTHMRWPNDTRLAEEVDEIDLFLGGHDHDYNKMQVNGKWVLKSGTDFRDMSQITLKFSGDNVDVDIEPIVIDSSLQEDPDVKKVVDEYLELMGSEMDTVIGHVEVELDGRFNKIRTQETNLGNFVTDIMLRASNADVAILNSGTYRSDMLHPKGDFKIKDLMAVLPMIDPLCVLELTGAQVIVALENGVCQYPKLEGRFAQVAGVSFAFDPDQPPGKRIDPEFVRIQEQYLDLEQNYRVVTKAYLAEGKDGYDVFKQGKMLVDSEEGPQLTTIVQNHFKAVQVIKEANESKMNSQHHQSIIPVTRRKSLVKQLSIHIGLDDSISAANSTTSSQSSLCGPGHSPSRSRAMMQRRASIQSVEVDQTCNALSPQVEGRIMILTPEKRASLVEARLCANVQHNTIVEGSESVPSTPTIISEQPKF